MNGRMTGHVFQRTWETNDGQECHSWAYAIERGRVDGRRLTPLTREPYKTKKDAENALRDELSGRELGTWVEPTRQTVGEWFTDEWVPALTEAVAGLSLTAEDLLVGGKRVAVLERLFDVQRGLRARDDTLPTAFAEPLRDGPHAGSKVDVAGMRDQFYQRMDWTPEGVPTATTFERLELTRAVPPRASR